jgi:hypothetical protein
MDVCRFLFRTFFRLLRRDSFAFLRFNKFFSVLFQPNSIRIRFRFLGYGAKILNDKFAPDGGFSIDGGMKDARCDSIRSFTIFSHVFKCWTFLVLVDFIAISADWQPSLEARSRSSTLPTNVRTRSYFLWL